MQLPSDLDQIIQDLRRQREGLNKDHSTGSERVGEIDLIVNKLSELRDRADETLTRRPKEPRVVPEKDETKPGD